MLVAIVLTFRRPAAELRATVRSVLDGGGVDAVIVVDNGDDARSSLSGLDDERVDIVETSRNLGYAGGMNAGIRAALGRGATLVALLNDDVEVTPGWLEPLQGALAADAGLGVVQPMLVQRADGVDTVNSMGVVVGADGAGVDLHRGEPCDGPWPPLVPITAFTGGAALVRTRFLVEVGLFDERYFLYYEDVDLAARGARRGWRYACVPASRVVHEGSATTSAMGAEQRFFQERNRLRVTTTHGDAAQIRRAWWLSVRRLRHRPRGAHARALLAGVAAVPSSLADRRRWRSSANSQEHGKSTTTT